MINLRKKHIALVEQIFLFKRLALFLKAGTPLLESLRMINKQKCSAALKQAVEQCMKQVIEGKQLSHGLEQSNSFSSFVVQVVRIGENTGLLAGNLAYIAEELEEKHKIKNKIIAALLYPTIIISATIAVIGILVFYVLPKILPVFESLHVPLPRLTRIILSLSSMSSEHIITVLIFVAAFIIATILAWRSKRLKKPRDYLLLQLPVLGKIIQSYLLANFCRTLGQLLQGHIPIMKAVAITQNTFDHLVFRQQIIALGLALNHGQSLSGFLEQQPKLFPPLLAQLVAAGERTGTLDENLIYASKIYEQDIADLTGKLSTLLEPSLMVVMGGVVGLVAISIITPIYEITQHLHG